MTERPRSIGDDEVMALLRKTLEIRPPNIATHWICRSTARTRRGMSRSTVHRVRPAFSIRPHRQKHLKL